MKHTEFDLQKAVTKYIRLQYPRLLFLSDSIASCKLTIPQQVRNKAIQCEGFKTPDIIIFEPKKNYSGLFIELKIETPYKINGTLKKNPHIEAQNDTICALNWRGYMARFAWTFEMAKEIIDDYMNLPDRDLLF